MARGTAAGEPVVSQANTDGFRDGYARTFGDKPVQRGRWVWDRELGKFVDAASYVPPEEAKDAPVMVGRFYEEVGPSPVDGSEINSRAKHREHMKRHGLTLMDDFKGEWARKAEQRERQRTENRIPVKGLRETLERGFYEIAEGKKCRRP